MWLDNFSEVYVSMSRNRLRIALTGFSIAWGIFMLIVLLGSGNGLLNGVTSNFGSMAMNKVSLYSGWTSKDYKGLPKYRDIHLEESDIEFLREKFKDNVDKIYPVFSTSGKLSYGQEYVSTSINGIVPNYLATIGYKILDGRDINEMDLRERRKVLLLTEKTSELLFGDKLHHLGQWVNLSGLSYQIVGYYKGESTRSSEDAYAPLYTIGSIYHPDGYYDHIELIVSNLETSDANEEFNKAIREVMSRRKQYDSSDRRALWVWNDYEDYIQTQTIFEGLRVFIWIIGLATLIAGVTGISNIMLITVKERTHEFGIRKALGARPRQIVSLVLLEAVAITLVFGYIGMFFGIGLTQLVDYVLDQQVQMAAASGSENPTVFLNPTVDLSIIIASTLVMVVAGVIAGYVPAKRAVSIKPVEALAAQ